MRQWIFTLLRQPSFGAQASWDAAQLARSLVRTAHLEDQLVPAGDRLGAIIRSAGASVLSAHLAKADEWEINLVNDLLEISLDDPPRSVVFPLMRVVLDLAGQDALGVPLSERLRVLDGASCQPVRRPTGCARSSCWRATTPTGPTRRRRTSGVSRLLPWRAGSRPPGPRARTSRTSSRCSRTAAPTRTVPGCTVRWPKVLGRHRRNRRFPPGRTPTRRCPSLCRRPGAWGGSWPRSCLRRCSSHGGRCWRHLAH